MNLDPTLLDDLVKKLSASIPTSLSDFKADLEKNFHSTLQAALTKLDLVTREEFDAQVHVLQRTREKLDKLETTLAELENKK